MGNWPNGIADKAPLPLDLAQREQIAIELEDAEKSWTPQDERDFVAELPPEVQASLDEIVRTADTEALKDALQVILVVLLLALLGSVFLSAERSPADTTG